MVWSAPCLQNLAKLSLPERARDSERFLAVCCGPSNEAKHAHIKPGEMPAGAEWQASTTARSTATCMSWLMARPCRRLRTGGGDAYGELQGEATATS